MAMAKYVLEFERPIMELEEKIAEMRSMSDQLDIGPEIEVLEQKVDRLRSSIYEQLTRWQRVQLARHPDRPFTLDYVALSRFGSASTIIQRRLGTSSFGSGGLGGTSGAAASLSSGAALASTSAASRATDDG